MSGYNGWNLPLRVTLTGTSNPYLADRLPLVGLLRVKEMRIDYFAQPRAVSFQELKHGPDGVTVGPEVMVDDAEFTYSLPENWKGQQQ